MPVDIEFSPNKRYIVYTITDPMNMPELFEAYAKEKSYRDSVSHTVHSIVDMSRIRRIPPNWLTAKAGPGLTHPRSGYMILVGLSVGFKIILQMIMKVMQFDKVRFVETREEANAILNDVLQAEDAANGNAVTE